MEQGQYDKSDKNTRTDFGPERPSETIKGRIVVASESFVCCMGLFAADLVVDESP